jgi:outer membrane biosynthesis protein TonB
MLALLLLAPVSIVSGKASDDLVSSLQTVRGQMTVCWQRKPPAQIKVALVVGADGTVTKATAKTKGAAAQCAAGILAVSTLSVEKAWKGTIAIEPSSSSRTDDVAAVEGALRSHSKELYACQSKAPDFEGTVALKLSVAANGTVTDASADADNKKVATCLAAAAKKLTLAAISADLTYTLNLSFSGAGSMPPAADSSIDTSLVPSKKGPLEQDDLMPVISDAKPALQKCAKGAKARGKVSVRVAIGSDGKVSSAKVKASELDDSKVEGCLVKVFKGLSFRNSSDETVVVYPMRIDDDGLKTGT